MGPHTLGCLLAGCLDSTFVGGFYGLYDIGAVLTLWRGPEDS